MLAFRLSCFLALLTAVPIAVGSPLLKNNNTNSGGKAPCTKIYQPVCAGDNRTYANMCEASNNLTTFGTGGPNGSLLPLIAGPCCGSVECGSMGYKPICATSGKVYRNACEAYLVNATIAHSVKLPCDGNAVGISGLPCLGPEAARCMEIYQPVCGLSNRTWGNSCWAEANGDCVQYEGSCSAQAPL